MWREARVEQCEESYEKTQSRLLYEQIDRPPSITTQACPTSLPRPLQQKPRDYFAKKSDVIIMKVAPCPTREVFVDPFPQDPESLFIEEDAVSAEFSQAEGLLDIFIEFRILTIDSMSG